MREVWTAGGPLVEQRIAPDGTVDDWVGLSVCTESLADPRASDNEWLQDCAQLQIVKGHVEDIDLAEAGSRLTIQGLKRTAKREAEEETGYRISRVGRLVGLLKRPGQLYQNGVRRGFEMKRIALFPLERESDALIAEPEETILWVRKNNALPGRMFYPQEGGFMAVYFRLDTSGLIAGRGAGSRSTK